MKTKTSRRTRKNKKDRASKSKRKTVRFYGGIAERDFNELMAMYDGINTNVNEFNTDVDNYDQTVQVYRAGPAGSTVAAIQKSCQEAVNMLKKIAATLLDPYRAKLDTSCREDQNIQGENTAVFLQMERNYNAVVDAIVGNITTITTNQKNPEYAPIYDSIDATMDINALNRSKFKIQGPFSDIGPFKEEKKKELDAVRVSGEESAAIDAIPPENMDVIPNPTPPIRPTILMGKLPATPKPNPSNNAVVPKESKEPTTSGPIPINRGSPPSGWTKFGGRRTTPRRK
jgi:hypothetical protein